MPDRNAENVRTVQIVRNSRHSFLLGASWSHDPSWPGPRLTHIYLGPWLMTVRTRRIPPANPTPPAADRETRES